MRVYDPEGNAHEKDPVDARECVEHCGYSYTPVAVGEADPNTSEGQEGENSKDVNAGPASGALEAGETEAVFEPLPEFDGQVERESVPITKSGKKAK